jgi:hypothetical protein
MMEYHGVIDREEIIDDRLSHRWALIDAYRTFDPTVVPLFFRREVFLPHTLILHLFYSISIVLVSIILP